MTEEPQPPPGARPPDGADVPGRGTDPGASSDRDTDPGDVASARRLGRAAYFDRWAGWHGGHHPTASPLVRGWLSAIYRLAGPMRGLPPYLLTAFGVLAAGGAAVLCLPGGAWPLAAAVLVVASGVADSLDGCVAMITGRDDRLGYVVDSVADRVSDAAYLVALWVLGAPGWLAAVAAIPAFTQEYARARAGAVGVGEIAVVSVFERPTRVILAALLLVGHVVTTAVLDASAARVVAAVGTAVWLALGLVGCAQVFGALARALRGRPAA